MALGILLITRVDTGKDGGRRDWVKEGS